MDGDFFRESQEVVAELRNDEIKAINKRNRESSRRSF